MPAFLPNAGVDIQIQHQNYRKLLPAVQMYKSKQPFSDTGKKWTLQITIRTVVTAVTALVFEIATKGQSLSKCNVSSIAFISVVFGEWRTHSLPSALL